MKTVESLSNRSSALARLYDATWGWVFTATYDRGVKFAEEAGLREVRRRVLGKASGRTVELGAGTGANVGLYPPDVSELVLVEPDRHMLRKLREKLFTAARPAGVVQATAENLPFADASFDTAVFALVLCTVPNPTAALAEVARVLKPGGKLLFIEHVRSRDFRLARWQDRFEKPWRFLGDGCHCNRDTVATIERSPFVLEHLIRTRLPKAVPVRRPLVHGSARI